MCKSMGEAVAKKMPVVLWSGVPPRELPQVHLKRGDEAKALALLQEMGLIKILWYAQDGDGNQTDVGRVAQLVRAPV